MGKRPCRAYTYEPTFTINLAATARRTCLAGRVRLRAPSEVPNVSPTSSQALTMLGWRQQLSSQMVIALRRSTMQTQYVHLAGFKLARCSATTSAAAAEVETESCANQANYRREESGCKDLRSVCRLIDT